MDVYQTLLPDELPQDYVDFAACNTIKQYHAWGEEKILLAALRNEIDCVIEPDESAYFALWMKTPLSKLRDVEITEDYIEEVLGAMGRLR
jgi:hypothetical protein